MTRSGLFAFFFTILLSTTGAFAQSKVTWEMLEGVTYIRTMDVVTGRMGIKPKFSNELKQLSGREILITGYIFPLDSDGTTYALSRYPYAACFFCGGASVASVMDVWLKDLKQRFQLDQIVTLQGTLVLNDGGDGLHYLIKDARPVRQ